uniref:Uncharacterized protein n=1 Tax=Meloidogyne enterolobii TaxID=390850 RepID=A0A6V7WH79_MELEN|nr:unnamed protein product [Meloidogyne enterolobii]CAD2186356.1 unnamed protein product [Meloidogyne enterolobii]
MTFDLQKIAFTINTIVDQIGIPGFLILAYVTIKFKTLNGTCHRLIGIYAICCVLAKIQIIPTWLVMITNIQIPLWLCALTDTLPIAGSFNIYSLMVMIAIDRILSMFFPIWYSVRGDSFHTPLMYGISSLFPLAFITTVIITTAQGPSRLNLCYLSDLITSQGETNFHAACLVFNWITLACYIIMIAKVLWDRKKGLINAGRMALFKSIAIIMGIQIFGWMFSLTAYNLVDNGVFSNFSSDTQILINLGINCVSSLSSTCEVPALFLSSSEHRKALFKTFGYEKKSTPVMVVNRNIMVSTQIMATSQVAPIRVG